MTAQELAERLDDWRKVGARYLVHCPAHDDQHQSLELKDGDKGVVMICRVGCAQDRVVDLVCAQAGITPADLFYEPQRTQEPPRLVATYDYCDVQGTLLFQAVRYHPKAFRQRRPNGHGDWLWNLDGIEPVLYRLPEVLGALHAGRVVYIVEGEKDVETLRVMGLVATCNPMGAGKWRAAYNAPLRGADVVILPDHDEPGRQHAQQVAQALHGIAASIKVVALPNVPEKGDVSDWVQGGGTREQLEALVAASPTWTPPAQANAGLVLTSLHDLLQEPEDAVEWLVEGLLPESGFSLLVAKPKVGKTTLARNLALCVAQGQNFLGRTTQQGPVIYLALEEKRAEVRKHFSDMGATGAEDIHVYIASAPADGLQQVRAAAERLKPVLVIIDPLFRLTRVKDGNDYAQMTQALEPLLVLARETRAHVLCAHHAGKGNREGGDSILGSTAIFGAVDTALIMKKTEQYRTLQSEQRYGDTLEETVLRYDPTTRTVTLGDTKEAEDEARLCQAIGDYLQGQSDPVTEAVLDDAVEGRRGLRKKALRQLVAEGKVTRYGKGGKADPFTYVLAETPSQQESGFCGSLVPSIVLGTTIPESENGVISSSAVEDCGSRDWGISAKSREPENSLGNQNPSMAPPHPASAFYAGCWRSM